MKYFFKRCVLVLQLGSTVADNLKFVCFLGLSVIIFFFIVRKKLNIKTYPSEKWHG